MNKIKSIIFDMDGVLIDAKEWHYEALNKALGLFGFEIDRYRHLFTFDGLPTKEKLKMLTKESHLPIRLHNIINELKQKYTIDIAYKKIRNNFQHEYALSRLNNDRFKLVVASNSIRSSVEFLLSKSGLINYLEFYLSNQDVAIAKPDPEIYLTAFKKLKLKPSECLILEDNINGIAAARESGAHVMVIENVHQVNYANIIKKINEVEVGL